MNDDNNLNQLNNNVDPTADIFNSQPNLNANNISGSAPVENIQPTVNASEPVVAPVENVQPTVNAAEPVVAPVESVQPTVSASEPVVAPVESVQPTVNAVEPVAAPVENVQPTVNAVEPVVAPVESVQPTVNLFEQGASNNVPAEIKKKGNKALKIFIIIAVIAALLVGGFFVVSNVFLVNGKNIVKTSITKVYDYLLDSVDKVEKKTLVIDPSKDNFGVNGNISFSSNYKDDNIDLTKLQNYNLSYKSAFDFSNDKMSFDAVLNKDNQKLLDFMLLIDNQLLSVGSNILSIYTYQKQLPSSIKFEFKQSVGYSDIKTLITIAKQATLDNIDESKITKESADRKVGIETKKYTKITYTIDASILKNIAQAYIDSDSALDIISRFTSSDKETIKNKLQEFVKDNNNDNELKLCVYVDGLFGKFAGLSIINSKDSNSSFELDKVDDNYQFSLNSNNNTIINGNYMSDTKTFNIYYSTDYNKLELSIKEISNTKNNISVNFEYDSSKVSFDATVENIVSASEQTINVDAKVSTVFEETHFESLSP